MNPPEAELEIVTTPRKLDELEESMQFDLDRAHALAWAELHGLAKTYLANAKYLQKSWEASAIALSVDAPGL